MLPYDGYGRVSRIGDRAERLRSFEFQEREIRSVAAARGLRVGEIITDRDESGANPERAGLLRAIERVEHGESAGIIVAKLDRFSRDLRQAFELAERVHAAGGKIISFAENPEWTTPEGELQVGIVFAFAQYERRVRSKSFDKAKARSIEHGVPVHPRLPPGLRLVRDEAGNRVGVEHDERVVPVMVEFFERRANGAGPSELAELLERHDVETSMGSKSWSKPAIYGLIRNRAYLGELRNGKHVNERAWDPIIDRTTWQAAQEPSVRQIRQRYTKHPDLAVGLARCASCGYTLNATNSKDRGRRYRCIGRHASGRCPAPASIYARDLEPLVLDAFWALVRDHHALGSEVTDGARLDELRQAAEKQERALLLYRDDPDLEATVEAMGGMDAWREGLRVRRKRRDDAWAALAREEGRQRKASAVPTLSALQRDWPRMSDQERRDRLADLIDCIAVLPVSSNLPVHQRVVVFAAGHGPTDLPRRGFRERPGIRPIQLPARARVLSL